MDEESTLIDRTISKNKKERLVTFYKNQKFADCTFTINGAEMKAHKLILACSSPVFEKMLFGDMASNEIVIRDINQEEFNQALEYIYTENIEIFSMGNAWALFYIANKYLLGDLMHVCLTYVRNNLTMNSLVLSYEFAEMYDLSDIKKKCFTDIVNYIQGVFTVDYHMKPSTLCAILTELANFGGSNLIVRILNWGAVECRFRKILATPRHIVDILKSENILPFIRKDWLVNLKSSGYCESMQICQCGDGIIQETLSILDEAVSVTENVHVLEKSRKKIPNICRIRKEFKMACRLDLQYNEEFVSTIGVNRRMIIFGLLINCPMNPEKFMDGFGRGSIRVRICELNNNVSIVKPTTFEGVIHYDSDLYVSLEDLPTLEPTVFYDFRIAYKSHGDKGTTSVHCFYMNPELMDESKNSVVSFYDTSGSVIKGLSFYAA